MAIYEKIDNFELPDGYRIRVEKGKLVLEKKIYEPTLVDITDSCRFQVAKSQTSKGYYVRVMYCGKQVLSLSLDGRPPIVQDKEFCVVEAPCSTISSRIMMLK